MYTLEAFSQNLTSLDIPGVRRKYYSIPHQINTADFPLCYPRNPTIATAVATMGGNLGLKNCTLEIAIIIESVVRRTHVTNYEEALAMAQNMHDQLEANVQTFGLDSWDIGLVVEEYERDKLYWVLLTRVMGSGV